jgi:DNA-binding transcriptional ArsR family regulator
VSRLDDYLREKRLLPDVCKDRYVEFESKEQAKEYFRWAELVANQRSQVSMMLNWMNGGWEDQPNKDRGGFLILRFPPPLPGFEPILPEVKPWNPLPKYSPYHYHGDNQDPEFLATLIDPSTGEPLGEWQIFTPHQARFHIDGKRHGGNGKKGSGANRQDVHKYDEVAKYWHVPRPIIGYETKSQAHRKMYERFLESGDPMFLLHLRAHHCLEEPLKLKNLTAEERRVLVEHPALAPFVGTLDEEHEHDYPIYGDGDATRVDIHPLAAERLESAEVVIAEMEGCVKSDALLCEIIEKKLPWVPISWPAVTQWPEEELKIIAPAYGFAEMKNVVMPDGDSKGKIEVESQAFLCRQFFRDRLGCTTHIAAPFRAFAGDNNLKAADDLRGARKAVFEHMDVIDRTASLALAENWLLEHGLNRRSDGFRNAVLILNRLMLCAGIRPVDRGEESEPGRYKGGVKSLARILDISHDTVERWLATLEEVGAITVEGSYATLKPSKRKDGRLVLGKFKGRRFVHGPDWDADEPPIITLADGLKAEPIELGRLVDVLADPDAWQDHRSVDLLSRDVQADYIQNLRHLGHPLREIAKRTGNTLSAVKKAVSRTTKPDRPQLSIDEGPLVLTTEMMTAPVSFFFLGQAGQNLELTLGNKGRNPYQVVVERPGNRSPRVLQESVVDAKGQTVLVLKLDRSGSHPVRLSAERYQAPPEFVAELRSLPPV